MKIILLTDDGRPIQTWPNVEERDFELGSSSNITMMREIRQALHEEHERFAPLAGRMAVFP